MLDSYYGQQTVGTKKLNYLTNHECGIYSVGNLKVASTTIDILISDNDCKRILGLSGSMPLKEGEGMFFVFENEGYYPFWMKEMLYSIDIFWISKDFEILGIEKNLSPDTYPNIFGEKFWIKYVLEIPANYSEKNNIKVGDKIFFEQK